VVGSVVAVTGRRAPVAAIVQADQHAHRVLGAGRVEVDAVVVRDDLRPGVQLEVGAAPAAGA
jgi:hypothetical protein